MIKNLEKNGIEYIQNANLADYSTMKCSERGKLVVFPKNIKQLKIVLKLCRLYDERFFVLGAGSNLIFLKNDFVFISTKFLSRVKIKNNFLTCGSGDLLGEVCQVAKNNNLSGLEGLFGIPASVGGAVCMNARAFGCEIGKNVFSVKCLTSDGKIVNFTKNQCNFAYKQSIFQNSNLIIVEICLKLKKVGSKMSIENKMKNYLNKRLQTQPQGFSSGCIFKNCHCTIAGKAIDCCGLGGFKFRNFEISKKHCNFILNNGKGKGKDAKILIEKIKRKVYNKKRIQLEEEVVFVGEKWN